MAANETLAALFTNIANAIRAKGGTTEQIVADTFPEAVAAMPVIGLKEYAENGWTATAISNGEITAVRDYAFYGDDGLVTVDMPNVITVKPGAFQLCENLTSFNFNKVTAIGDYAFGNCSVLGPALELPKVKFGSTAGRYAFQYDTAITSVSVPVTNLIPHSCFIRCTALESISLPQAGTLNDWCFSYCTALKEATLPAAKVFTRYAFASSGLEKLVLPGTTVVTIAVDTFQNSPIANGNGYVYVPDDLLETYKAATNWVNIADRIKPLSELPE